MTKTTLDICTRAMRQIGVLSVGENLAADDFEVVRNAYEAEFERINTDHSLSLTYTANTVPDALLVPWASVAAAAVAPIYLVQGPNLARAIGQIRSYTLPDDREDWRDLDEDGTVSESEENAAKRAQYY
jgi:hypothetical protein